MGTPDSPRQGAVNWESYTLPQLIAMVTERVDLPATESLADDWRWTGNDMVESARDLADALDTLMDFWSGAAAEQARTDVALNAQWLSDLGATAYQVGTPIEQAAGALQAAQNQMPQLPEVAREIAPGSAPDGAAAAELAGGPLGAAIGGAAAGTESAAEAEENEANLKRQAVETMRRFEAAVLGIDRSIPEFEGPSTVLRPREQPQPTVPPVTTTITLTNDTVTSWQGLTGAQDFDGQSRGGAGHSTSVGAGAGGFGGGALAAGGGALGVTGGPGGRAAGAGSGGGTGAVPGPERMFGPVPAASAGAMVDPDGHPGGMAGTPMAGMGAGAGTGSGNDDHRRRFPFEAEDPFGLDKKASPPVIGL